MNEAAHSELTSVSRSRPTQTSTPLAPVGFGPGQRRPNFLVIGSAKAGTTDFCHKLSLHPDVFLAPGKEMNFFSRRRRWRRGFDWYASCFRDATTESAVGEGSPEYSYAVSNPDVVPRIAEHLPDVRLFYMVRHPMSRAGSHWMQLIANGTYASQSVSRGIDLDSRVLEASLYHLQVRAYLDHFPAEQVQVIFFDDWVNDRAGVLRRAWEYLGVMQGLSDVGPSDSVKHVTRDHLEDRPITRALRSVPGMSSIGRLFPVSVQLGFQRRFLRRPCNMENLRWTESAWNQARRQVEDDTLAFLEMQGKPADYWDLSYPATGKVVRGGSGHA